MSLVSRLLGRRPAAFTAPLAPAERLAVIGDIHGCLGLLDRLLDKIAAAEPARLVFVGDFVDRGDDSAGVIARLRALAARDPETVFIRGNHEDMMLRFIDDPVDSAERWLRYGGLQTLASFGISGLGIAGEPQKSVVAGQALAAALGPEALAWLRALPRSFVSGNLAVVHAGANPNKPIAEQSDRALTWGHPDFFTRTRSDGTWVAHGHTVMDDVTIEDGRIGVDTGAYATGRLSAALVSSGGVEPLTAT